MIVLQFAAQDNLPTALIELYGHGFPSHVDLVLPDGGLLGARIDADGAPAAGVQIRKPGYANFTRIERWGIPVSPPVEAKYYELARAQIGKPYDWQAIAAFAVGRDWRNPDAWMCSELQTWLCEQAPVFIHPLELPDSTVIPRDLWFAFVPWATKV